MAKSNKTYLLILCSIFAALTAVCSWISIPLPFSPVPITLTWVSIFLAAGLLGKVWGTASISVYVLLGAIGAPVFHGFTAGFGIIAGPTGGYIIGYIAQVFIAAVLIEKFCYSTMNKEEDRKIILLFKLVFCMEMGGLFCYAIGTAWFVFVTNTGLWAALFNCVFPFIIGDILKAIIAAVLIIKLKPHINI
ncbi:MAG: biotin transporter BioY [Anaerovoracaceae bacterium]